MKKIKDLERIWVGITMLGEAQIHDISEAIILDKGEVVCQEMVCPRCKGKKYNLKHRCSKCQRTGKVYEKVKE